MQILVKSTGRAGVAAMIVCSTVAMQPATAQSNDASRPGDLFSFNQIGEAAGQILQNNGVYLNAGYVNNILADVKGGNTTGATATGDAFVSGDFDMNTIAGIPDAAIHVVLDDRTGRSVSTLAGTQFGLSGQNGPSDTIRLSELSWDQSLFDDHLRLLVGRINPTAEFATSDISCVFASNITCAQPFAWYVNNSGPAYPVSTWGGRMTVKPTVDTYLRVGAYQDDPTQGDVDEHGFNWGTNTSTGVFIPFEIGDERGFSTARYPFKYDIGGYYDTGRYTLPAASGSADLNRRGRTAFYAQMQQTVWRPDPATNRGLTLFAGVLDSTGGYQVYPLSVYAGAYIRGPFAARPNDAAGFEASYVTIDKNARGEVTDTFDSLGSTAPNHSNEWIFEADYKVAIAPGIALIPDAQYVVHPDEIGFNDPTPGVDHAFVIGAQVAIDVGEVIGLPHWTRVD
ncbi:MAG TPA: carbohydrate porin [Rhodopila sp.]